MDRISDGKLIWQWSGVSFETFGTALQYYEQAMASIMAGFKVYDFSYAQIVDLACKCYKPLEHSQALTPEILGSMDSEVYITVKKKLYATLPWREIYEQSIFASEKLGSGIPEDMKEKESIV